MNIYTKAYNAKKPKKDAVAELLEALYDLNPEMQDDIAAAYKYFMPAQSKTPKNAFEWVALACSKQATRPYLNFVWCTGEEAVAIDGHRLHYAPCDKPEGYYDHKGNPIALDLKFPDWQRVFPNLKDADKVHGFEIADNKDYKAIDSKGEKMSEHHFQIIYVDSALSLKGDYEALWTINGEPMQINFNDGRKALIMPMKLRA